jgi:hypothetical protein
VLSIGRLAFNLFKFSLCRRDRSKSVKPIPSGNSVPERSQAKRRSATRMADMRSRVERPLPHAPRGLRDARAGGYSL